MNGYIYAKRNTGCDRTAIQDALNEAARLGRGTVILEGDFSVNGTLHISDNTHLIIKNGTLYSTDSSLLLTNSNCLLPRTRTLFGTQEGITVSGENGCVSGKIEFFNVRDFSINDLSFKNCESSITLAYATCGHLKNLIFCSVNKCITAAIGTRNCTFTDIKTLDAKESIVFSSVRLPESRRVNYFGPDVNNNVVIGLISDCKPSVIGDWCYDILICED